MSGLIRNYPLLGWLFFIVMLSLAGIPPFSGFVGKVLVGQGAIEIRFLRFTCTCFYIKYCSFFIRFFVSFIELFLGETIISKEDEVPLKKRLMIPCILLTVLTIALGVGAESISSYVKDAADTLINPNIYIEAILGEDKLNYFSWRRGECKMPAQFLLNLFIAFLWMLLKMKMSSMFQHFLLDILLELSLFS